MSHRIIRHKPYLPMLFHRISSAFMTKACSIVCLWASRNFLGHPTLYFSARHYHLQCLWTSRNVPGHPTLHGRAGSAMSQVYSALCVPGQLGMSWDIQHSAVELGTAMSQVWSVCVSQNKYIGMSWDIQHCCRARHCHGPGLQCSVCTGTTRNVPGYLTLSCTTMSQVYSVLCVLGQVGMSRDIPHSAAMPCPRSTVSCVPQDK